MESVSFPLHGLLSRSMPNTFTDTGLVWYGTGVIRDLCDTGLVYCLQSSNQLLKRGQYKTLFWPSRALSLWKLLDWKVRSMYACATCAGSPYFFYWSKISFMFRTVGTFCLSILKGDWHPCVFFPQVKLSYCINSFIQS